MRRTRTRKQRGRGLLFANGGGCMAASCSLELNGGSKRRVTRVGKKKGGDCGCGARSQPTPWKDLTGGYKPTKRNRMYLAKWKRGESIGFTMRSSLKAKGLIPRSNGTYKVSPKYRI